MGAYYHDILRAIEKVQRASGTLDEALGAALEAVASNPRKAEAFAAYRAWFGLEDPKTAATKGRLLLLLAQNFALSGLALAED